jgi:hypothetical protein
MAKFSISEAEYKSRIEHVSDTVLITEEGAEIITYYPRNLEALTIS